MDRLLEWMRQRREEMTSWIADLARIESPSHEKAAVDRAVDFVEAACGGLGRVERLPQADYGDHLRVEFDLPGGGKKGLVLGLGHLDTVYPLGTLGDTPVREQDGRLYGPGVFDMKAGVAFFLFAARALRELDIPVGRRFIVQLYSDEEIGSPSSRPFTEELARAADAVLVAEPSYGPEGAVKTARKGGGGFQVTVRGRASHAGLDFAAGASAIVELARQIERIAGWTDLDAGVTVNPGVVRGGTTTNVVAEEAWVKVDVRVPRLDQALEIERRFHSLEPFDPRCRIQIEGGLRRPPLERTTGVARLYERAHRMAAELGFDLPEAAVGGGSDGNYAAAVGAPVLDGLGAVGDGAHSTNEHILLEKLPERAALLAKLIVEA